MCNPHVCFHLTHSVTHKMSKVAISNYQTSCSLEPRVQLDTVQGERGGCLSWHQMPLLRPLNIKLLVERAVHRAILLCPFLFHVKWEELCMNQNPSDSWCMCWCNNNHCMTQWVNGENSQPQTFFYISAYTWINHTFVLYVCIGTYSFLYFPSYSISYGRVL